MAVVASASPVTTTTIPSPQSMDPSTTKPSSETASDCSSISSPSHDHSSNHLNRSISLPRDGDVQSPGCLRSEEYRQLFRLPPEAVLIQDFNCALQESILLQGHMYLFDRYICFYSNIFGFETKKIIPFHEVSSVRRAKTAGIFPNAIEIVAGCKKHFFASFLSRDEAFKLIADRWTQHSDVARAITDQQDSKSESSSNGVTLEKVEYSELPISEQGCDERKVEAPVFASEGDDSMMLPPNVDGNNTMITAVEVQESMDEQGVVAVDAEPSTSESIIKWKEETFDAPAIPKSYTKVAESKFPIKMEDFFNLFFSDDAVGFTESFHKRCGDKDFKCTRWSRHDKFGIAREVSFQHPIKVYFGAKYGCCKELQSYQVYRNSHLVIKTSQEISDVPYADYFTVEGLWDVESIPNQSRGSCILRVYVNVAFSKKTMWRGKIEQSTIEECREAYANWIDLAHEVLKQKKIEKREEGATANLPHNVQVCLGSAGRVREQSAKSSQNIEPASVSDEVPCFQDFSQQTGNSLQGILFDTSTIASMCGALTVKFYSFLKSPANRQLLLVTTFAFILLLMQLSIVVLLSRPQQIHVIPQADHITAMGIRSSQSTAEAMAWLEKRIYLLKDEMLVVEAQLDRMRHEQRLLKAQLKDLERLSKQR
ncbi:GRAM domain-containing protein [Ancistrocladus abbreviatus]